MYLIAKSTVKDGMMEKPPFGPGFTEAEAEQADSMEIWGSSFSDPGQDQTEFRLIKDGVVIRMSSIGGY